MPRREPVMMKIHVAGAKPSHRLLGRQFSDQKTEAASGHRDRTALQHV